MIAVATATATEPAARSRAPGPLPPTITGATALIRFMLRRDRVRLPVWLAMLTVVTMATAASFAELYPSAPQRQATAESMDTPAGLAMTGPARYLADYNIGSMLSHQMIGFMAALVALMSVLAIVRHTRAEEESGRAELIRASVVGRHAPLAAAMSVVVGTNLVLAGLLAVGLASLGLDDLDWWASLLYGASHAAVGVVFAGVAAVAAQITGHARGASGMALAVLGVAYVLRAAGDAGIQALSWVSPIGWAQATYVFVDDRWWPLLPAVALSVALAGVATLLSSRRDVGAGLRPTRPGPPRASAALAHPLGLALRLQRALLISFVVGLGLIGVAYGSILAEVEQMLTAVEGMEEILAEIGGATLVESYLSMIMVVMAVIASVHGVLAALRPRTEERAGRAEPLLSTPLSRSRWVGSHVVVAVAGSTLVLVVAGLMTSVAGWLATGDASLVGKLTGAALAYAPALWVAVGVAVALYGLAPRAAPLAWVVPAYGFGVGYLGQILQLPEWLGAISPFEHVPQLPAEELAFAPLAALTAVAAALIAVGLLGVRRRDLVVG